MASLFTWLHFWRQFWIGVAYLVIFKRSMVMTTMNPTKSYKKLKLKQKPEIPTSTQNKDYWCKTAFSYFKVHYADFPNHQTLFSPSLHICIIYHLCGNTIMESFLFCFVFYGVDNHLEVYLWTCSLRNVQKRYFGYNFSRNQNYSLIFRGNGWLGIIFHIRGFCGLKKEQGPS